jgi:hypothetical protein
MPFLKARPTVEDYDSQVDLETAKGQVLSKQRENAELEAGIKELKSKYGPGWKKILGVGSKTTLQDIQVFLRGAKKGLEKSGGSTQKQNTMLSPIVSSPIGSSKSPIRPNRPQQTGGSISVLPPSGIRRA